MTPSVLRRSRPMLAALLLVPALLMQAEAQESGLLKNLRPSHPRLLATAEDFSSLRTLTSSGKAAEWKSHIRREAEKLLKAEPSKYEIPDGKRLLATSRRVLNRTLTLGLTFRLTDDRRFADRLWRELDAAARFKDWNPSHFLDTAEMTAAFAIGYDWLHSTWTPEQRATLRTAILEKGLKQALPLYRGRKSWTQVKHNWSQVCNGGMTLGALAIAEDQRAIAEEILTAAVASVPKPMHEFAPDGAWGEGPSYWDYAVSYNVFMLAAMDTALGTDAGLSKVEGFSRAADFPIHVSGPLGRTFNYADAGDKSAGGPHILWLAGKFSNPAHAAWRLAQAGSKPDPLDLLYGARWLKHAPASPVLPPAKYFRGSEVVTLRSAWNDPLATFVGFKGGDNTVNHGHLDLGSFVLDAAGERWAVDLGGDDYNLPAYFGKERWNYYRTRAEGQNTLVIAPDKNPDQNPQAKSAITRFSDTPGQAFAIADLTGAYAGCASAVQRGVRLTGKSVLVQDEIRREQPAEAYWFMHTGAKIECRGRTAILRQNGKTLSATLLSPADAAFTAMDAAPLPSSPAPAKQQTKATSVKDPVKLTVRCASAAGPLTISVLLSPGEPGTLPPVTPLAKWR